MSMPRSPVCQPFSTLGSASTADMRGGERRQPLLQDSSLGTCPCSLVQGAVILPVFPSVLVFKTYWFFSLTWFPEHIICQLVTHLFFIAMYCHHRSPFKSVSLATVALRGGHWEHPLFLKVGQLFRLSHLWLPLPKARSWSWFGFLSFGEIVTPQLYNSKLLPWFGPSEYVYCITNSLVPAWVSTLLKCDNAPFVVLLPTHQCQLFHATSLWKPNQQGPAGNWCVVPEKLALGTKEMPIMGTFS